MLPFIQPTLSKTFFIHLPWSVFLLLLNLSIKTQYFESSLNPEFTDLISRAYKHQIQICLTFHSCLHLLSISTCWLWQFVECTGVFNSPRHFKGELREPTLEFNALQQRSWIYWWFVEDLDLVFVQNFYLSGCLLEGEKREFNFYVQHETKSGQMRANLVLFNCFCFWSHQMEVKGAKPARFLQWWMCCIYQNI